MEPLTFVLRKMEMNEDVPRHDEWTPQAFETGSDGFIGEVARRTRTPDDNDAQTIGALGVYRNDSGKRWRVTHLPTGFAADGNRFFRSKRIAKLWAESLMEAFDGWEGVEKDGRGAPDNVTEVAGAIFDEKIDDADDVHDFTFELTRTQYATVDVRVIGVDNAADAKTLARSKAKDDPFSWHEEWGSREAREAERTADFEPYHVIDREEE